MNAVVLITLFSMVMGLIMSFAVGSSSSQSQMAFKNNKETETYFQNFERVINQELTPDRLQAVPAGTVTSMTAVLMQSAPIRAIAPGKWGNPLVDAWGVSITVHVVRENIALSPEVTVPVTGIALISGGRDRIIQTAVAPAPTTIAALQGVVPATNSDDIVRVFTDQKAQERTYNSLRSRLQHIADQMEKTYRLALTQYSQEKRAQYVSDVATNPATPPVDILNLLLTDSAAPAFSTMNVANERRTTDPDTDAEFIQRLLPDNGNLRIDNPANQHISTTLRIVNDTLPSPWGVVNIKIPIKGEFE